MSQAITATTPTKNKPGVIGAVLKPQKTSINWPVAIAMKNSMARLNISRLRRSPRRHKVMATSTRKTRNSNRLI